MTVEGFLMDIVGLAIQIISGAVGGNAVGSTINKYNLGPVLNTIAGAIGGALGGQLTAALGGMGVDTAGTLDMASIFGSLLGGGVGGILMTLLAGFIKSKLSPS